MSKLYKLTDEKGQTRGGTQWGPGVSHSGTGCGGLCSPGWIHAYEHPLVAVLLNPIHGKFRQPRMWEAEGEIALRDGGLRCGCKTLTTVREIPVPFVTTEHWIRFAILCAKRVCQNAAWNDWADVWLSGNDRSAAAAWAAEWAANAPNAAWEAARAAQNTAAQNTVVRAARAAAWAAREARAAETVFDLAAIAELSVSVP